jgi:hypothetical protein
MAALTPVLYFKFAALMASVLREPLRDNAAVYEAPFSVMSRVISARNACCAATRSALTQLELLQLVPVAVVPVAVVPVAVVPVAVVPVAVVPVAVVPVAVVPVAVVPVAVVPVAVVPVAVVPVAVVPVAVVPVDVSAKREGTMNIDHMSQSKIYCFIYLKFRNKVRWSISINCIFTRVFTLLSYKIHTIFSCFYLFFT